MQATPLKTNLETETIEISINLNGTLRVDKPQYMSTEDAERLALELVKDQLSKPFTTPDKALSVRVEEARVWADTGSVQVGNLFFDVLHDVHNQVSCVVLDAKPEKGEFGENRLRSRLKSYVTPHCCSISAVNPKTQEEQQLVSVAFNGPQLAVYVNDLKSTDLSGDAENIIQMVISTDGFVSEIS